MTDSITAALWAATKTSHYEAETTGIIRHLLRGQASRDGYILLMRNVLPAYRALEKGLATHRNSEILGPLAAFAFDRAGRIDQDLRALTSGDVDDIALLPQAQAYADAIEAAAQGDGAKLIAHAYTRYLGDLSGGQILRKLLAKKPGLRDDELSFYDFPGHDDLATLKDTYRAALDQAGAMVSNRSAIVAEGDAAFRHNIAVSCAVEAALPQGAVAAE